MRGTSNTDKGAASGNSDTTHDSQLTREEIRTLEGFIRATELFSMLTTVTIYRGQPLRGTLLPSIVRQSPTFDSSNIEQRLLDQFRLMGVSMLGGVSNQLELMVIAQHYGLRTRLLDWTLNPLIALYFACSGHPIENGYVYRLLADDLIAPDAYTKDPFAADKTRVFQPPLNNPRIIAQQGWFSLHKYSKGSNRFIGLEKNKDAKGYLTEIVIPRECKPHMLMALARHGIASHTVYPDLAGLAAYLNTTLGRSNSEDSSLPMPKEEIASASKKQSEL